MPCPPRRTIPWPLAIAALVVLTGPWIAGEHLPVPQTPQAVADELLAADRAAAAAAKGTTVIPALTAMFTDDVIMPAPGVGFARGLAAAREALAGNPDNTTGTLEWTPAFGGVSADGLHGFTAGYMTLRVGERVVPVKYVAYWIKQAGTWKVAAYKRRRSGAGAIPTAAFSAVLPAALVPAVPNRAATDAARASLVAAEQAFSDEAQRIGIGAAFATFGDPRAINMGHPDNVPFDVGAEVIGRNVGTGAPTDSSPVSWSADEAIVAGSGDFGVTFGYIRTKEVAGTPAPPPAPFFTIWRRASATAPWRYIAE